MAFLPSNYKEPVQSNYMDFDEGDNTFRVLDSAVLGYEYWVDKNVDGQMKPRPIRVKEFDSIPLGDVNTNKYGNLNFSFFWAFPVYNFDAQRIQILTIKQKTIRRVMEKNIKNPKWGDPTTYNFVVTREKDDSGKTVYSVTTEPKEKLDKSILDKFADMKLDMQVWFASEDPFTQATKSEESEITVEEVEGEVPPF